MSASHFDLFVYCLAGVGALVVGLILCTFLLALIEAAVFATNVFRLFCRSPWRDDATAREKFMCIAFTWPVYFWRWLKYYHRLSWIISTPAGTYRTLWKIEWASRRKRTAKIDPSKLDAC